MSGPLRPSARTVRAVAGRRPSSSPPHNARTARGGVGPARLTPHVLRVTATTLLLDAGAPSTSCQRQLAHSSPVTTQRYDHSAGLLNARGAYRLAGLLGGGT
ncbi:tyrosine-type recombinase/integrase [Spirillospora sp. NBC_00431]